MPKNSTVSIKEAKSLYTRTMLRWIYTSDPVELLIEDMNSAVKMVESIKDSLVWPGKMVKELENDVKQARDVFVLSTRNTQEGVKARLRRELCRLDIDDFILMTWVHTPEWDGNEYACQAVTIGFHDGVEKRHTYSFTVRKCGKGYEGSCTLTNTDNSLLWMAANAIKELNWDYILHTTPEKKK